MVTPVFEKDMGFILENIVPWGRSYTEYVHMFALTPEDLGLRILGCGDGPAAFNAVLSKMGGRAVSVDPLYAFSQAGIRKRIDETFVVVLEQLRKNQCDYVWDTIHSVEELGEVRMTAMATFLDDLDAGKAAGRYVVGTLPWLAFGDGQFDLALSSHFLFLYSAQLDTAFHIQAIAEMLRVAREVRIFPILTIDGKLSPHVDAVCAHFSQMGFTARQQKVPYMFQQGGDIMLVIRRSTPQTE